MLQRVIKLTATAAALLTILIVCCERQDKEVHVEAETSVPETTTIIIVEEQEPEITVVEETEIIVEEPAPEETEPLISDEELDILARCVEAEAGNQGLVGKRLVVDVILNRVDDADWPDTISEVITKPYEFSSYWNGMMDSVTPTEETYEAIWMELETRSYPGLFYFTAGGYSKYGTPWRKVGDHYFSTK